MNKESEDYLDRLLSSVQDTQASQQKQHKEENPAGKTGGHSRKHSRSQKDFIREFEQELSGEDEEQLISDFELSLEQDLFSEETGEDLTDQDFERYKQSETWSQDAGAEQFRRETTGPEESEESFFAGLDAAMNMDETGEKNDSDIRVTVENTSDSGIRTDAEETATNGMQERDMEPAAVMDAGSEPVSDPGVGGLSLDDFPDLFGDAADPQTENGAVSGSETLSEQQTVSGADPENADDILSLLDGLGEENEDIADISNMLKADENHEAIEPDGMVTAESVADSLADLGFEVNPEDVDELAALKEMPPKQESSLAEDQEGEKPKDKKGFLEKVKNLFFGPDEEEVTADEKVVAKEEISGDTDENLDILKALEGGGAFAPEEDDPKAKKKAKKEEKKKAAAAKKEVKAKEKEAKKKEKAAAKAAKPKKAKKPKVKDNTPPLPKKPVFLIFLLAVSILGSVLFAGKGVHRRLAMSDSENYYSQGDYVKAYNKVAGLEVKADNEKETQYMEKIKMLAGVQELYDSYESLLAAERQELALDCLIRIIGHYDANIEKAGELGCSAELTEYEGLAEELLKETYHTSFEEALRIYQIRSRVKYSTELVKILKEAGLD